MLPQPCVAMGVMVIVLLATSLQCLASHRRAKRDKGRASHDELVLRIEKALAVTGDPGLRHHRPRVRVRLLPKRRISGSTTSAMTSASRSISCSRSAFVLRACRVCRARGQRRRGCVAGGQRAADLASAEAAAPELERGSYFTDCPGSYWLSTLSRCDLHPVVRHRAIRSAERRLLRGRLALVRVRPARRAARCLLFRIDLDAHCVSPYVSFRIVVAHPALRSQIEPV